MARPVVILPPVRWRDYFFPPRGRGDSFPQVALTLRGRMAIALAADHSRLGGDDCVLLPGYLCDAVPAGFGARCRIEYYDLREDFSIDADAIERRLVRGGVRVLFLIHYFGFLHRNLGRLSEVCKRTGTALWEDHAHSALSHFPTDYADVMIFSFRKLLPIADGGGLWVRDCPQGLTVGGSALKSDLTALAMLVKEKLFYRSKLVRRWMIRMTQHARDAQRQGRAIAPQPMSRPSRWIVRGTDLGQAFEQRRQMYRQWLELLRGGATPAVFPELPEDVCPMGCPVWIGNPDEVMAAARRRSWFLYIHWRTIPPEVKQLCPVAWGMSRRILTLPIYPGLRTDEMEAIADFLRSCGRAPGSI